MYRLINLIALYISALTLSAVALVYALKQEAEE